jgi:hypothetical protein
MQIDRRLRARNKARGDIQVAQEASRSGSWPGDRAREPMHARRLPKSTEGDGKAGLRANLGGGHSDWSALGVAPHGHRVPQPPIGHADFDRGGALTFW